MPEEALLNLRFFVDDVFSDYRIELFSFQFVGAVAFVFGGCVVVTSAGARHQFDFILHVSPPNDLHFGACGTQVLWDTVNAVFVYNS